MDRTVSGDISSNEAIARISILSDDSAIQLEEQTTEDVSGENTLGSNENTTRETSLSNDDINDDDTEQVFKSKEKRRRELRSVLKNKNPTPRREDDDSIQKELSLKQSPSTSSGRECCCIL